MKKAVCTCEVAGFLRVFFNIIDNVTIALCPRAAQSFILDLCGSIRAPHLNAVQKGALNALKLR